MTWISGPCSDEPGRAIWDTGSNFAGIVDRINPGHWRRPGLTGGTTVDAPDTDTPGDDDEGTE